MEGASDDPPLRLGISRCLLGEEVRWDGDHRHDLLLLQAVGSKVEWVPVCPEVELGMGVPREPVQLIRDAPDRPRMVGRESRRDWTDSMQDWAQRRVPELIDEDLDGFVLKRGSPSCGVDRVKLHEPSGEVSPQARGLFAAALMELHPRLPVEEDERLQDPQVLEQFLQRAAAFRRLKRDSS
jgi:uncharacterized protein YbbK (DUF523 family)